MSQSQRWLSVNEFLKVHPKVLGRNTIYERIRDGTFPHVRLGRRLLIPEDALDRLLEGIEMDRGSES